MITLNEDNKKAVVLLSGGMDSATVLAYAIAQDYDCYTLSFDYGQKHAAELDASKKLSQSLGAVSHRVVQFDLKALGGSALTDDEISIPDFNGSDEIPVTYVPARNTIFLSVALGWAETLGAQDIFIGISEVDYSGYPDCRPEYLEAFEKMANLATKAGVMSNGFKFHAPLAQLSKAATIQMGVKLGVDYSQTITCYRADVQGLACGTCDSCVLRRRGFEAAGETDVTRYVTDKSCTALPT